MPFFLSIYFLLINLQNILKLGNLKKNVINLSFIKDKHQIKQPNVKKTFGAKIRNFFFETNNFKIKEIHKNSNRSFTDYITFLDNFDFEGKANLNIVPEYYYIQENKNFK